MLLMDTLRTIEKNGIHHQIKVLPEIGDKIRSEARRRAESYPGVVPGEKRGFGTYLMVVATMHFLRLPPEERTAIYAEMRAVMDSRLDMSEEADLKLPPYCPRGAVLTGGEPYVPETGDMIPPPPKVAKSKGRSA